MAKRSNKAPQDQQGRRRSKRLKKSSHKAEALRKSEIVEEDEDKDPMTMILGNGNQTASNTNRICDAGEDKEREIEDEAELDETCLLLNNVFELHNSKMGTTEVTTEELMKSYSEEVLVKVGEGVNADELKEGKNDKLIKTLTKDLTCMEALIFEREKQIKVLSEQNNQLLNSNSYRKEVVRLEAEAENHEKAHRRLLSEVDRKSNQIVKLEENNTMYKGELDEALKQLEESKTRANKFQEDLSFLRTENQKLKNRLKVADRKENEIGNEEIEAEVKELDGKGVDKELSDLKEDFNMFKKFICKRVDKLIDAVYCESGSESDNNTSLESPFEDFINPTQNNLPSTSPQNISPDTPQMSMDCANNTSSSATGQRPATSVTPSPQQKLATTPSTLLRPPCDRNNNINLNHSSRDNNNSNSGSRTRSNNSSDSRNTDYNNDNNSSRNDSSKNSNTSNKIASNTSNNSVNNIYSSNNKGLDSNRQSNNMNTTSWSLDDMNRFSQLQYVNNNAQLPQVARKKLRPGSKTYSGAVVGEHNLKTTIFSTSMTRGIDMGKLNGKYINGRATIHRFHGGKARHIKHQIGTHLDEEWPDVVVIQCGGNDLPTSRHNPKPVLEIANHIMDIVEVCRTYSVKEIIVCNVLPRESFHLQLRRKELNDILRSLCSLQNVRFLDNDNHADEGRNIVLSKHIADGVHLNSAGDDLLMRNLIDLLNSLSC